MLLDLNYIHMIPNHVTYAYLSHHGPQAMHGKEEGMPKLTYSVFFAVISVLLKQPSDRLYVAVTRRVNERGSAKLTREEKWRMIMHAASSRSSSKFKMIDRSYCS